MKRRRLAELVREEAEGLKEAPRAEPSPGGEPQEAPSQSPQPTGPRYLTYVREAQPKAEGEGGADHGEHPHPLGGGPPPGEGWPLGGRPLDLRKPRPRKGVR